MKIFGSEPFGWRDTARGTGRLIGVVTGAAFVSLALFAASAGANPLTGSSFDAANGTLTDLVDHDWNPAGQPAGNIGPLQAIVCPTVGAGTNCGVDRTRPDDLDDSFTQGPKEDDPAPVIGTGSIPPNKDDLSRFYINTEKAGGQDFLYLGWERTNALGSAHMDFEFNQNSTNSANGVTKVRTAGDVLITFDFGGSGVPVLDLLRWVTTGATSQCEASNSLPCWGNKVDLTASGFANGAVNSTNVLDFNPPNAPRTLAGSVANNGSVSSTFGEAAINLAGVIQPGQCTHFGAAMLKSRSSGQSFTSSLKDFIAPIPVNITNCGSVIIRKVTDPPSDPTTTRFGYTKAFNTAPATDPTFQLGHGESKTFAGVLPGTGYTVTEDSLPSGWDFASLDCSASTGVTPSINGTTVTFDINDPADILDCTYTNRARATLIVEKITDDGFGAFNFTSLTLDPSAFTLTTTAAGDAGKDSRTFGPLVPGTYDVAETVPAGWNLVSATCSDGSMPGSVMLAAGETVTCTFHDTRERGAFRILKNSTKGGAVSQPGAVFSYDGPSGPATVTDNGAGDGDTDVGEVCVSGLLVGDYTVNESTPPPGYGDASQTDLTATVVDGTNCGDNQPTGAAVVTFINAPLADIQVNFRDGGSGETSADSITCANTGTTPITTPATGWDQSVTHEDISIDPSPRTITCTIVIDP